jgi:hypothetical protein
MSILSSKKGLKDWMISINFDKKWFSLEFLLMSYFHGLHNFLPKISDTVKSDVFSTRPLFNHVQRNKGFFFTVPCFDTT